MDKDKLIKPTKFKIIFTILGILAELYSLIACYNMDGGGCPKFFYFISRPFFIPLERIGDVNIILMFIASIILFGVIFYVLAMVLEFLYELVKQILHFRKL